MTIIYAVHLKGTKDYRFIGISDNDERQIMKTLRSRCSLRNREVARSPYKKWLATVARDDIAFTVLEVLEEGSDKDVRETRQHWIDLLSSQHNILNTFNGVRRSGTPRTEEHKQEHSEFMIAWHKANPDVKKGLSDHMKAFHQNPEKKEKHRRGLHNYHHTNKGVVKDNCEFCQER